MKGAHAHHPSGLDHAQPVEPWTAPAGAGDDVVRLSIGPETVGDITADLDQALAG
jgi:O-acetylhomoserine (thiol)-lyase